MVLNQFSLHTAFQEFSYLPNICDNNNPRIANNHTVVFLNIFQSRITHVFTTLRTTWLLNNLFYSNVLLFMGHWC